MRDSIFKTLSGDYNLDTLIVREALRVEESFDMIERHLTVAGTDVCLFYIDGFTKDGEMLRIMQYLISLKSLGDATELMRILPYLEVERVSGISEIRHAVLSGQTAILAEKFGTEAILLDLRTYPARTTEEPESDRVMQGQAVDVAVEMVKNEDNGIPVPNYTDENVSTKIVKLIQSYTGVVNKMVWRKE